jgi:plastocyanin
MRIVAGILAFVIVTGLAALPAWGATVQVQVFDSEFSPDPTINVGDTVRWVWNSFTAHNVRSVSGAPEVFDSGHFAGDEHTFEHTFTKVGVVNYYCDLHGFDLGNGTAGGMAGRITVVPEPAMVTMLLPGAVLLARRGRRG